MSICDLSVAVRARMPAYPGDPPVDIDTPVALANGDAANVSRLRLGAHTGTHVDAPAHFLAEGRRVIDLPRRGSHLYSGGASLGSPMRAFRFLIPLLGGPQTAGFLHHLGMWLLLDRGSAQRSARSWMGAEATRVRAASSSRRSCSR